MGLKQWILPNNHFKTHFIISILVWGAGDPPQLGSWAEGKGFAQTLSKPQLNILTELNLKIG